MILGRALKSSRLSFSKLGLIWLFTLGLGNVEYVEPPPPHQMLTALTARKGGGPAVKSKGTRAISVIFQETIILGHLYRQSSSHIHDLAALFCSSGHFLVFLIYILLTSYCLLLYSLLFMRPVFVLFLVTGA